MTGKHAGVYPIVIQNREESSVLASYFIDIEVNCRQESAGMRSSEFALIKEIDQLGRVHVRFATPLELPDAALATAQGRR